MENQTLVVSAKKIKKIFIDRDIKLSLFNKKLGITPLTFRRFMNGNMNSHVSILLKTMNVLGINDITEICDVISVSIDVASNNIVVADADKKAKVKTKKSKKSDAVVVAENESDVIQHFHLILTKDEYEQLVSEFGKIETDIVINSVLDKSKDYLKKYSSFFRVAQNWAKRQQKIQKPKSAMESIVNTDLDSIPTFKIS